MERAKHRHREARNHAALSEGNLVVRNVPRTVGELEEVLGDNHVVIQKYKPSTDEEMLQVNREHDGQRKLLLSEIEFLSKTLNLGTVKGHDNVHVFYLGAAPGDHLKLLIFMFPAVRHWHLIDPAFNVHGGKFEQIEYEKESKKFHYKVSGEEMYDKMFEEILNRNKDIDATIRTHNGIIEKVSLHCEYANKESMGKLFDKVFEEEETNDPTFIFISDIRHPYDVKEDDAKKIEALVKHDMGLQRDVLLDSGSVAGMLKFRPPYGEDKPMEYLDGELYLPVWGRRNTSEVRWVRLKSASETNEGEDGTSWREYNPRAHEDLCYTFNHVVREDINYEALRELAILQEYEASLEVHSEVHNILQKGGYNDTTRISRLITAALGDERKVSQLVKEYRKTSGAPSKPPSPLQMYRTPRVSVAGKRYALALDTDGRVTQSRSLGTDRRKIMRQNQDLAREWNKLEGFHIVCHVKGEGELKRDDVAGFEKALERMTTKPERGTWYYTNSPRAPDDTLDKYPSGKPILISACMYGRVHIVRFLVETCGCSVTVKRKEKRDNALHAAAFYGNAAVVRYILTVLEKDGGLREKLAEENSLGETPLMSAANGKEAWMNETVQNIMPVDSGEAHIKPWHVYMLEHGGPGPFLAAEGRGDKMKGRPDHWGKIEAMLRAASGLGAGQGVGSRQRARSRRARARI